MLECQKDFKYKRDFKYEKGTTSGFQERHAPDA